ncbi:hypothetical protein C8Q73DRAFT_754715 [Cubamyces lactineus]|nr:hypothetical protein C8Q73DRAFT_754715 [Cubamyces lactineus]
MTAQDLSESHFGGPSTKSDIFPYPNRGVMKTDILFSSPMIRFSRSQKEAILAWGRDMGAKDVPSLYGLENFQTSALHAVGDPTEKVEASSGNIFYMNSIYQALAHDYSHPEARTKMRLYPEFSETGIEEVWQASKWLVDAPDSVLTPMTRINGKDYFVNELVLCTDNLWFVPTRFFEFRGALWAKGRRAVETEHGLLVAEEPSVQPCSTFHRPWPEVQACLSDLPCIFAPPSQHFAQNMPHPDRQLAGGLEIECPPIIVFVDDVSGNTSKQWNVHYSAYMSNATLPRADLEKSANVHFIATSPHASPMEIIRAICEAVRKGSTTPFKVWDSVKKRHILFRPWILFLPGDNPMQAEMCSHIGLKGNHFCRMCHCGGDQKYKASDEGFTSLMTPGRARSVSETREAITSQLVMATHAAAEKPLKAAISASGVKDSFATPLLNLLIAKGKILRRATPTRKALNPELVNKQLYDKLMKNTGKPMCNPLLDMDGLNVHLDTPVEALHTHLLGVVKYFWAQTVWILEKKGRFADFQARLNSLSRIGLKVPNIMADYMCRYRGSLIGKHFKTISQIMAFAVCGLVDEVMQNAWLAIGRLTVLIWETKITDIKAFAKELREVIEETIDFAASLSPGLLTEKNKFHILAHLPDHVERFGPALLFSTERYESFNHIFRLCSIHSNRQAPSRDIARTFANQERCRHMVTGGYWQDKTSGDWVRASSAVLQHIANNPIDARLIGILPEKSPIPGDMTLLPLPPRVRGRPPPQHPVISWAQTESARLQPSIPSLPGRWHPAGSVIALNGDSAPVGAEVIVRSDAMGPSALNSFASIVEVLLSTSPSTSPSWVIVRDSILSPETHSDLKMPVINRTGSLRAVRPEDIICVINVQHDCITGRCTSSGTEHIRQEREQSIRTRQVVKHTASTFFVINVTSLHNQRHLRNTLPPRLLKQNPFFEDRSRLHLRAAQSLRDTKLQKKLAREAQVRRNAELALRNSVANSSHADFLGISTESVGTTGDEFGGTAPGSHMPVPSCHACSSIGHPDSSISAPRGPRQKKGARATRSAAPWVPPAPAMNGDEPREGRRSESSSSRRAVTISNMGTAPSTISPAPPRKRKRPARADPESSAAREALFRGSLQNHQEIDLNGDVTPQGLTAMIGIYMRHQRPCGMMEPSGNTHTREIYQEFARTQSRKYGLSGAQVTEVLAFSELSPVMMLIDLKIHQIRTENDFLHRFIRVFVRHPDFGTHLRHSVAAALLAPRIPAYVDGLNGQFTAYLEDNAEALLGIPESQKSDPADWSLVKTAIGIELANQRSGMRAKVCPCPLNHTVPVS